MDLRFNRDFEARHGEAVAVAPSVRRVTAPNAGPFTFQGTNTFLIGGNELAVIDPGPADPTHIEAIVRAIGSGTVRHILITHTHRDHSPGAPLLQARTGGEILAAGPHRPSRPLSSEKGAVLDGSADLDFRPDATISDGDVAAGAGYRLEALSTPGHTANHLAFALLGTDLLFSGDHVMGWSTTVVAPPDGSMRDYMASLERLMARAESTYLPAHGGAISNAHSYVRGLRAHRRMRERAILERLAAGDHSVEAMVRRIYAGLDPRLATAAGLSVLAHLEELIGRGIVEPTGPLSLKGSYRLTGSGAAGEGVAMTGPAEAGAPGSG